MFFRKKVIEPLISDESAFTKWWIEHCKELEAVRAIYSHDIRGFVEVSSKGALAELSKYRTGEQLFERLLELSEAYETKMKPLVLARGELRHVPQPLQGAIVGMLVNIFVAKAFLVKKYQHPEAISLFNEIDKLP